MKDILKEYKTGDFVTVKLPHGQFTGKIFAILPNYAWGNETKYEVHGHEFVTITSSRGFIETREKS